MTRLHLMPGSCALSCHVALEWAGMGHEAGILDDERVHGDAFLAVSPKGEVPALRPGDGAVLTEAPAILVWIGEAGGGELAGTTPLARARRLEALSGLTGEMHPAFAPLHGPSRYTGDKDGEDGVKAAARDRVLGHYDRRDAALEGRDWVLGPGRGRRGSADACLVALCRWTGQVDAALDEWPQLDRFAAAMRVDPGVRAALAAEDLDRP